MSSCVPLFHGCTDLILRANPTCQEFGIDIVSDDSKTIVHHKVAAKVFLVMNQEDAAASSRCVPSSPVSDLKIVLTVPLRPPSEFNNWYRHAGEQPIQRRGPKQPSQNSNGLSFEHVLSRLQGELQKSRDTSTNLGDLTSTLNEVQDTLGGGAPPPLPPFPHPSRGGAPPPSSYQPMSGINGGGGGKDAHAQSIAALQSQLNETQSSLAGHVGKIRDLEGLLAEHDVIKREVGSLRTQMESLLRLRAAAPSAPPTTNGRESPVAAMLDSQEDDSDDDDSASVSSVGTVRISTAEQRAISSRSGPNGHLPSANGKSGSLPSSSSFPPSASASLAVDLALQEQNAKLAARLEALSAELDEATKLGQTLRSQHAEASLTIRALEARIQGLEKAVEGASDDAAEARWRGWRDAFEESWNKERASWDVEREKLRGAVREWEERKRVEAEEEREWERSDDQESDDDALPSAGQSLEGGDHEEQNEGADKANTSTKGVKTKRPRSRRRRRSTATRVSTLAGADQTIANIASDSDSTIGDSTKGGAVGSGPWSGPQRGGPFGPRAFDNPGGPRGPGTVSFSSVLMI